MVRAVLEYQLKLSPGVLGGSGQRSPDKMTANDAFRKLDRNVTAFYAGLRTYQEFSRRQRAIWMEIEAAGLRDAVLALWREAHGQAVPA